MWQGNPVLTGKGRKQYARPCMFSAQLCTCSCYKAEIHITTEETLHQNDRMKLHVKVVRFCKASNIITALKMPHYRYCQQPCRKDWSTYCSNCFLPERIMGRGFKEEAEVSPCPSSERWAATPAKGQTGTPKAADASAALWEISPPPKACPMRYLTSCLEPALDSREKFAR